jgi:hypothetical protein
MRLETFMAKVERFNILAISMPAFLVFWRIPSSHLE